MRTICHLPRLSRAETRRRVRTIASIVSTLHCKIATSHGRPARTGPLNILDKAYRHRVTEATAIAADLFYKPEGFDPLVGFLEQLIGDDQPH